MTGQRDPGGIHAEFCSICKGIGDHAACFIEGSGVRCLGGETVVHIPHQAGQFLCQPCSVAVIAVAAAFDEAAAVEVNNHSAAVFQRLVGTKLKNADGMAVRSRDGKFSLGSGQSGDLLRSHGTEFIAAADDGGLLDHFFSCHSF